MQIKDTGVYQSAGPMSGYSTSKVGVAINKLG